MCSSCSACVLAAVSSYSLHCCTALQELTDYFAAPYDYETSPWDWWRSNRHTFPTLARVAAKVLIIPATSVAVERLFSKVKQLVTPQRASLSAERIDQIMLIKENIGAYPHALSAYKKTALDASAPAAAAAAAAMEH